MIKLDNISIRYKLILVQVFTSVLVVSVFFAIFTIADINSYKERKVESMLAIAQVLGTNSIAPLRFQDNETANETLEELRKVVPDIVHAEILDNSGKPFARYSRQNDSTGSVDLAAQMGQRKYFFTNKNLVVRYDITENREKLGKVLIEVELTELQKLKAAKYRLAILLVIAAIGFSLLLAIALQTYISKRLLRLANTMRKVSETGNYSLSVSDQGKDEISLLTQVFNNLMQQVKENQQRKDEFIGVASHELKTPLTSIKGYVELLKGIEDRKPHQQFVQKTLDNVIKLEKLIQDLLDVSRIQSGQLQLNLQEFSIDHLLDEAISNFQLITDSHEFIKATQPIDKNIIGDKQRIEQVLINIFSNAVKYSPNGKKVIVHSEARDGELIIKIRDFGVGIPRDEQQNIFERFYRTRGMPNTISGFGLGLYISRDIIQRHKGRIWVESEEKGSAFYFSLPLNSNGNTQEPLIPAAAQNEKDSGN